MQGAPSITGVFSIPFLRIDTLVEESARHWCPTLFQLSPGVPPPRIFVKFLILPSPAFPSPATGGSFKEGDSCQATARFPSPRFPASRFSFAGSRLAAPQVARSTPFSLVCWYVPRHIPDGVQSCFFKVLTFRNSGPFRRASRDPPLHSSPRCRLVFSRPRSSMQLFLHLRGASPKTAVRRRNPPDSSGFFKLLSARRCLGDSGPS